MDTDDKFIWSYLLYKKCWGSIGMFNFFVGREKKGKRHFRRLGFCAVPRMLKSLRRKDDRKRAGEGRLLGQA